MQVSGRGVGWEQIGGLTGDLMGDLTGDSVAGLSGEPMGDLVGELGREETGTLAGEAAAAVGEWTEERLWAGPGERHCGLLAAGDGVVLSGFVSSGMNGSGKKRVPGDFTSGICKERR